MLGIKTTFDSPGCPPLSTDHDIVPGLVPEVIPKGSRLVLPGPLNPKGLAIKYHEAALGLIEGVPNTADHDLPICQAMAGVWHHDVSLGVHFGRLDSLKYILNLYLLWLLSML